MKPISNCLKFLHLEHTQIFEVSTLFIYFVYIVILTNFYPFFNEYVYLKLTAFQAQTIVQIA